MDLYARLADLPVTVESHELHPLTFATPRMVRTTTTVILHGGGFEGRGEDVSYAEADQAAHIRMQPLSLEGTRTLAGWSAFLEDQPIVPDSPSDPSVHPYRRWAYESALLDLGLKQSGATLADLVEREPQPVRFCVSSSLGPAAWHDLYPDLEFKVDIGDDWDEAFVAELAALDRVRVVDFKAHYTGDFGQAHGTLALLERVLRLMPDVIIEDPATDPASLDLLAEQLPRVSFDAPIHSVEDIRALPTTGCMNIKPSRFGTLERLCDALEYCEQRGLLLYGGGQFELGVGRRQIQELASLFSARGPNDVAPSAYNAPVVSSGLPPSPLTPAGSARGFGA